MRRYPQRPSKAKPEPEAPATPRNPPVKTVAEADVELLRQIAFDQAPSIHHQDLIRLMKQGWVKDYIIDVTRPGYVIVLTLSIQGELALRESNVPEQGK